MSTEHEVRVVCVGPILPHGNADALSITHVDGRPVVVRTGEFREGDAAVYLPVDTLVPVASPRFAFLVPRGVRSDGTHRVKAARLRGVFSMGLLTRAEPDWSVGDEVSAILGTRAWEPDPERFATGGEQEPDPGYIPTYTDIESLRKWRHVFDPGEEVIATEKIHGANARLLWRDGRMWCGSRTQWKRESDKSLWWVAARPIADAVQWLGEDGLAVFGEVYGQVQDLTYGVSGARFVAFDVMSVNERRYVDADSAADMLAKAEIPSVPTLWRGPFGELDDAIANGKSVLANGACVREGVVVRPVRERWHPELGRVILKLVGEDYLLRKEKP